jgi:hypothetical protein
MDMDKSAIFLASSILIMLGFVVVTAGVIVINNIIHKYWKPVKMWTFESYPPSVMIQQKDENKTT